MWKRLILIVSLLALGYGVHTYTEGFSIAGITSGHNYGLPDFGSKTAAIEILDQPFHYMASGGQSYVFLSDDGCYVLKFFKGPLTLLPKVRARKITKISRTLLGYELLQKRLPSHSATIYAHLSKSPFRNVILIDKCGIHHTVDLSSIECILQRHVEPLNPDSISKVHALADLMAQEKMTDSDPRQHKNWGVFNGEVVIFDAGRVAPDPQGRFHLSNKYISWEKSL